MRPGVFLDLNGTLVMPVQAVSPSEYRPIAGAFEAIRLLNERGFLCPIVTVQSRIEKGAFSESAFRSWFRSFVSAAADAGAEIAGLYLCPHRFSSGCVYAKPNPALYYRAAGELSIDVGRSYVVGDTRSDMDAARRIGATACLVLSGWGHAAMERGANLANTFWLFRTFGEKGRSSTRAGKRRPTTVPLLGVKCSKSSKSRESPPS